MSVPGPKLHIAITVLPDGEVIFGDLPPELAEVVSILAGSPTRPPAAGLGPVAGDAAKTESAQPLPQLGADGGDSPESARPV